MALRFSYIEGIPKEIKLNSSNQEFLELPKSMGNKNKVHAVHDWDKKMRAAIADKTEVITECKRQLYDINTRIKLSVEEMGMLVAKIKSDFSQVVN